jgi:small subunit ribosomal protein S1
MVNRNLLREYDLPEGELQEELSSAFQQDEENWLPAETQAFEPNKLLTGRVLNVIGDEVWIDVGYKSEGLIKLEEWYDEGQDKVVPPHAGDVIQVLLDTVEDESGAIVLSYRKAKRQKEWEEVIAKHKEGDVVAGHVTRKIKGGLLVNIGVNVFLPASQVDIRRPPDIGDYIGKTIECKILKIDEARRNIVVSRRKLIEDQREEMKKKLWPRSSRGKFARAWSRTSPILARSWTSAASMACCTSPT